MTISKKLYAYYNRMSMLISDAHQGQKYGDKPYTHHLRDVELKVNSLFYSTGEEQILLSTAALGHDLLEDTLTTANQLLEEGYDQRVVETIDLVTKKEGLSYKDYLRKLSTHPLAWKVKVADTYSNLLESIKDGDSKRVRKYAKQLELLYKYQNFQD
ncbi:putative metal dependent phosphohydrolase HD region [Vibrio phage 193E37-1]|nr:putative metal dependent phosphohydrolase HD region [Vibrio phage 193E37-1]